MPTYCSVVECSKKLDYTYTFCNNCYNIAICDKQDQLHSDKFLYNEGCSSHSGYSVCILCALENFQTANYKKYKAGEEHCWCPLCQNDFGLLKDLPNAKDLVESLKYVQEEFPCSIEGCVPVQNSEGRFHWDIYGHCQSCEEFYICHRNDSEHQTSLLYHEPYNGEHEGTSFCKSCTVKAYKEKYPDSTEIHCICPLCSYDFGALKDL